MIKPTFLSWILVTVVFIVAMYFDGLHFSFGNILVSIGFFAFIGFIVAVYFLIFGGIALLLISGLSRVNKSTYLLAAFASSLPMLFFCILSREPEWIIATLVAGVGAGLIYAGHRGLPYLPENIRATTGFMRTVFPYQNTNTSLRKH